MDEKQKVKWLLRMGWCCFLGPAIGWPLSYLPIFLSLKQDLILGLSWVSPALTGLGILLTATVRQKEEERDG